MKKVVEVDMIVMMTMGIMNMTSDMMIMEDTTMGDTMTTDDTMMGMEDTMMGMTTIVDDTMTMYMDTDIINRNSLYLITSNLKSSISKITSFH